MRLFFVVNQKLGISGSSGGQVIGPGIEIFQVQFKQVLRETAHSKPHNWLGGTKQNPIIVMFFVNFKQIYTLLLQEPAIHIDQPTQFGVKPKAETGGKLSVRIAMNFTLSNILCDQQVF